MKNLLLAAIALLSILILAYHLKIKNTHYEKMHWQAAIYLQLNSLRYRLFDSPQLMSPEGIRRSHAEQRLLLNGMRVNMQSTDNIHIPGKHRNIPLRVYKPTSKTGQPIILNLHGGAFILGNNFVDEAAITHFASVADCIVVSVDYSLAPSHPFPTALEEASTALQWLSENAQILGGDAQKLGIMGSSAGANIAAALVLKNRDQEGVPLLFQFLQSPLLDLHGEHVGSSYHQYDGLVLSKVGNEVLFGAYVPDETKRNSVLVSPVYANSFDKLPPTYIAVAELDPLRDQGIYFGEQLADAGVPVVVKTYSEAIHGFTATPHIYKQSNIDAAKMLHRLLSSE